MAGIQQYTSSLFVQSGSRAKFESGLEVTESVRVSGAVSASAYFDLEGNEITGGTTVEFFAGSGSGVSASNPSSIDTFIALPPDAQNTGQLNTSIFIHTTHSNTFFPNHYAFVKILDEFETVQQGAQSFYNLGTLDPGVYRYLVYGAQTGSGGETHQVYTTVFVKGFVNEAPVVIGPTASNATMSIAHDETQGSLILFFTNSFDPNGEDAIAQYTASRELDGTQLSDPNDPSSTQAAYTLVMSHSNFSGDAVHFAAGQKLQTESKNTITLNGLGEDVGYINTLFFTASVSDYTIVDPNTNQVHFENRFDEETFRITLKDYSAEFSNQGVQGVSSENFTLHIQSPPTASISNIKVKFENDGFTGIDSDALTHTLLYDRTESLSSASIATLNDRYTSSLIRISTQADIEPPSSFTPPSNHTASIRIQSSSGDDITFSDRINKKFSFFRFQGGEKTASFFGNGPSVTSNPTESLGYTSFIFKPVFSNNTQSIRLGANTTTNNLNKLDNVRYGNNNHYQAFTTTPNILTIHNIPNIEISDIVVEVESGSWGTDAGYPNLTSSLLYGYTSSLLSSQTQSLLIDLIPTGSGDSATDHPQYNNYISSSVIRLRVKAKITEPFGPDHKPITFKLTGSNQDDSLQFSHEFIFATNSADTASSNINYSDETKQRLVGIYTSSWQDFNFPEGVYNFTTHLVSSSNAGSTIGTISTAELDINNYGNVELSDLIYETEHSGLTGSGVNDTNIVTSTTRSVLYGHDHSIFGISSSYHGHPSSSLYASHSLFRMRVRGKITEPFGPATSKLNFTFKNKGVGSATPPLDELANAFTINTTSSNVFINNQLVTVFTSSLIGKDITFENVPSRQGPSKQTDYTISGSVNFDEDSTEEFEGVSTLDINNPTISQIKVIDTPATIIENIIYETETFGHSGIISNNTTRSVLYGDPHVTNATSASTDWENHPTASTYASHSVSRFRVRAKVTEPLGFLVHSSSFENQWISSSQYSSSKLDFFTGSVNAENSSSAYNEEGKLVTSYTSSFMGAALSSSVIDGINYLFTSGNILHEPIGENGFTTASGISSNMLVKDTPQVIVNNICEFEEYGHSASNASDSGVTNTERTVLYGDSHITNDTSGSKVWENHENSASYASHSVSRARIKVEVIEPLGPAHYKIKNIKTLDGTWETVFAFTGSTDFETSSSAYDGQDRLVTSYTESWKGRALSLDTGNYGGSQVFNLSLNTNFNSNLVVSEENPPSISTTPAQITVNDTPATIIDNIIYETETFGHSGIISTSTTRSILYGDPHITNDTSESKVWETHPNSASYASHSVSRFRVRTKITEPLGFLHHSSSFENQWISSSQYSSSKLDFFTGSINAEDSSSAYDSQDRLVTSYTSSFMGAILSSSVIDGINYLFTSGNILHEPVGENKFTTASGISSNVLVKDTPATEIEFTPIEIETFGDSNIGISNTNINNASLISRSIRLGQNTTDISSSGIDNFFTASSVSRFRTKVTITEPLGPLHHSSSIRTKFVHLQSLAIVSPSSENVNGPYQLFSTNSANIFDSSSAYDGQDRLVTSYTSSFTGSALKSTMPDKKYRAIFKNTEQAVIHNPIGENSHNYTSFDGSSNLFFVVSKSEGSEASTKIDNVVIEVESGSFNTNEGHFNLTSSILYGFTSSLLSSVTKSLIDDVVGTSHPNYSDYISQSIVRLRIKAKVTEPYGIINNTVVTTIQTSSETPAGAFDSLPFTPPTFNFNPEEETNYTVNTLSANVDGDIVQVSHFTSSFVEIRIPSGTYTFTASFDSQGTTEDETISSISTAEISMSSVAPTRFEDLRYEMEKHGYAGSGSNDVNMVSNTSRTVLFGDSHLIHNGTSSGDTGEYFASHASSSIYASQSVARFRVRGKMIEPFGPGTTNSTVDFNITSSGYSNLIFGTASIIPNTNGTYNSNKELITVFTSSFESQSIQLIASDFGANNEVDFHVSGNVTHNPISLNNFIVSNPSFSTITVKDTPQVIVNNICEFEEYGHSASNASDSGVTTTTRTVLYGDNHVTNDTSGSKVWENHENSASYASHSVSRARVKIEIIEPVGPAHDKISIQKSLDGVFGNIEAFTGSSDFELSSSIYDSSNRLKVSYTESWVGRSISLDSSNYGGSEVFTFGSTTTQNISGENGLDKNPTNGTITVNDTPATIIENIIYETETFGHSGIISTNTTRSILHGDPHITNADSASTVWETHPSASIYASHSVSRFRIRAKVTEPLGFLHHSSSFEETLDSTEYSTSSLFDFFTGSSDVFDSSSAYDGQDRLVTSYTTSFNGHILSSSVIDGINYLFTSGNILHEPVGENGFITESGVSSNMLVKDTPKTLYQVNNEIETFGYSNIGSTGNVMRTVLYGDKFITNDTSESKVWENHPSASIYASHSVTRRRLTAKIIEPLGYASGITTVTNTLEENGVGVFESFTVDLFTSSGDFSVLSHGSDSQHRLVAFYTQSFDGFSVALSTQNQPQQAGDGQFNLFVNTLSSNVSGSNGYQSLGGETTAIMQVNNTPPTQITINKIEIGSGSVAAGKAEHDNNESSPNIIKQIPFNSSSTKGNPSELEDYLEPHSLTRFRILTDIIEPVGYIHYPVTINYTKQINNVAGSTEGSDQIFATQSSDIENVTSFYNDKKEFIAAYTSSFLGEDLTESHPNFYKFTVISNDVTINDNNTFTSVNNTEPDPTINISTPAHQLNFIVSSSDNDPLQIKDIVVEVESASGDLLTGFGTDKGSHELSSSLLYGYTASLLSSQTQSLITNNIPGNLAHPLHDAYCSASIVRYRIKSKIIEPFGSDIHIISASFSSTTATGETLENTTEPRSVTVTDHFIGHSGTPSAKRNLLTSIDLVNDADDPTDGIHFTGNRTLRLVSMSIKGDLDVQTNETIISEPNEDPTLDFPHGLTVGGQRIIENADKFLENATNYHVLLPGNLTQIDTNNAIELENVTFTSNPQTESISMVDGKVGVSMSIHDGVGSFAPIHISATFEFDEITGTTSTATFEEIMLSPTFSFADNQPTPPNDNLALSVRSSSISFIEGSDGLPRRTQNYTSSWVELQTPTGSFTILPLFNSSSATTFISSVDSDNRQIASVTMSDALPTQLVDLKYETEKHGYAGSGSNDVNIVTDTIRTVLYGDSRITNETSESKVWETHPSASVYASHSVSRFRVRGRIIEPFGPATSTTDITLILTSSTDSSHDVVVSDGNAFESINTSNFAIAENYIDNKLNSVFTSSFTGEASPEQGVALEVAADSTENYIASGTINYSINPSSLPGTNIINVSTPTTTNIKVIDTAPTQLSINRIETETFGESNIGAFNNNENIPFLISRSILYNENITRITGSDLNDIFTGSVVTRFRILADVIEPVGYFHTASLISFKFLPGGGNTLSEVAGHTQSFSTASEDIDLSSSIYDSQKTISI